MLDTAPNLAKGFIQFIREQGVVGLAIGFILGGAVSRVVASLTSDIINPLVGLAIGSIGNLSEVTWGVVQLGSFLTVVIDFFILAAVVYWGFKGFGLDTLDVPKQKAQ